ncbi:sensor histidine kinase [Ruminococcus flavefaciens]|uniref:sensor histidine kinase n=1 Tax=Ruminococcus flavefaciens TaxID=1265 RepID=UPI00048D75A1|nr:HAMP domain-containing sensor histidine kinase [Ruminococcus flavefaciens]
MSKLLRNGEVYRSLIAFVVLSLAAVVFVLIYDDRFLIPVICLCCGFILIHFITVFLRYKKISELTSDIDRILHGEENIDLEKYAEGELALLHSEVYKMTVRLREQQSRLVEDKIYLADFLADVSHQIRTPLTSINILVSMLSEPDMTAEKREQTVHKLYGLLSRIDWLITALLKMSKLDTGTVKFHQEKITMQQFIDKACMPVRIPIELHGQELVEAGEGELECDIAWSCEAVGNIVKNCMEHTPDGGTIKVTGKENALYYEIIITDSGSGISSEDLPHIFERFYKGRSNEDKGGFGIGLALARMIITGQNGTVKAENYSGGAMFTVRFYKTTV